MSAASAGRYVSVSLQGRRRLERRAAYLRLAAWAEQSGRPGLAGCYRARADRELGS